MDGGAAHTADVAKRYIDLLEAAVRDEVYGDSKLERVVRLALLKLRHPIQARNWNQAWPARAHTMLSRPQMAAVRRLVESVLEDGVEGDFIETGVWRGGTCILMRGILAAHGVTDRRVFVADSFEGLPRPDAERYPADRRSRLFSFSELAISEAEVRRNFAAYGLLDDQVVFLKGFFKDTLPAVRGQRFALLRLDGDLYESTMDALTNLYDQLSSGGYVIVDDYGALAGCRRAVHDFLDARGVNPQISQIDECGVWWRKA